MNSTSSGWKEKWSLRLLLISSGLGIVAALAWWLIDVDTYTAMAYTLSFSPIQGQDEADFVFLTGLAASVLGLLASITSLCYKRRSLAFAVLVGSLVLTPVWWYEIHLTAKFTQTAE